MKTVILCRHAESKENVKIRAYKEGVAKLSDWSLPSRSQLSKSLSLLKYNTDEDISPLGRQQILTMAEKILSDGFLESFRPEVVCHSPLRRARDTCRGIFGSHDTVSDFLELSSLIEMTPLEIFLFNDRVKVRIKEFEDWLASRPEERVVVVGHSRYFKVMLGAEDVMDNCSIVKCLFNPSARVPEMGRGDVGENTDARDSSRLWQIDEVMYTLKGIHNNQEVDKSESGEEDSLSTCPVHPSTQA